MDFYTTIIGSTTPVKAMTLTNNGFIHTLNRIGVNLANATNTAYRLDVNESSTTPTQYIASFKNTGASADSAGVRIQSGLYDPTTGVSSTLINFQDGDGGAVGSISFDGGWTRYNTTSDRKLKENIVDTSLSLSDLMNIKIRDYNWKIDKNKKIVSGVIAQELYEIYPMAVTVPNPNNPDGIWQVDYSSITPLIIKSIQDQQIEILDLQLKSVYQFNSSTASSSIVSIFMNFLSDESDKIINGIVTMKELIADKITAKEIKTNNLCIGDTCITEEQFKQAFTNQNNIIPIVAPEIIPDTTIVPAESVLVVEPSPVVEPVIEPALIIAPEPIILEPTLTP